jgi:hypothetical protein
LLTGGARAKRKVKYAEVVRGLGFAQAALVLGFLGVIPVLSHFALILSTLITFVAGWLASATAFNLRGWRLVVFPLVMIVVFVVSAATIGVLLKGAAVSITTIAQGLGFTG